MGASFSLFLEEDFLFVVSEGGERVFFLFFLFFFDPDQSPPLPKALFPFALSTQRHALPFPDVTKKRERQEEEQNKHYSLLFTWKPPP